ncbi:MAG: ubiquinone biosynthesis protein UbiJ [bacterium]|jgi:ubiquinone biosynthesis protein UbiJ
MSRLPSPINAAIEQGIDALLQLDPQTRDRLDQLEGRVISVNIIGPDIEFVFSIVGRHINVIGEVDKPADTTLTGSLSAFRSLASSNDALYKGDVSIKGNMHIGQQLKEIVAKLNPDWEEFLSPILSDTVVHQLNVASKSLSSWLSRTRSSFEQNTSEYLQEEAELLAPNSEVHDFCLDVDAIRAAADRLEARIKRLEQLESNRSGENGC